MCIYFYFYIPPWVIVKEEQDGRTEKRTTIVLFSGDYDKAMAAYIIANGAAAYDHEVTIFHTFGAECLAQG